MAAAERSLSPVSITIDTHGLPFGHRLGAGGLNNIRRGNNADGLAVLGKKHRGFALLCQTGGGRLQGRGLTPLS